MEVIIAPKARNDIASILAWTIRQPRHFLLYRVTESNIVEIGRVLHDSLDLQANLPKEYRGSPE